MNHLEALGSTFHNECSNALSTVLRGCASHDNIEVGQRAVGAPELLAVDDPGAVCLLHGLGNHAGRVGSCTRLGESECRELTLCNSRKPLLLLFFSAKEFQRLRDTDRLMR